MSKQKLRTKRNREIYQGTLPAPQTPCPRSHRFFISYFVFVLIYTYSRDYRLWEPAKAIAGKTYFSKPVLWYIVVAVVLVVGDIVIMKAAVLLVIIEIAVVIVCRGAMD